jgi:hypothetical protein
MNIIEKIQSLRAAFESATQKFADYTLGDLTVRIDGEPVIGAAVTLLDADGNPIDATGEHTIPSLGTVVVANGVIESITPEAAAEVIVEAAEPADAAAAVEEVAAVVEEIAPEAPSEVVAAISAEVVAEIMEKLEAVTAEIVEMKKAMMGYQDKEKQMFDLIEQVAKMPSVPAEPKKVVGQFKKDNTDRLEALTQTLKTLKTK